MEKVEEQLTRHERERALRKEIAARLLEYWNSKTPGFELNEEGHRSLEKWRQDFSDEEIMRAMDTAELQYVEFDDQGECTRESVEHAFGKIPGICFVNREGPEERDIYYIRGILRNRIPGYFDSVRALQWLRDGRRAGVSIRDLKALASSVHNWTELRVGVEDLTSQTVIVPGVGSAEIDQPPQAIAEQPSK